MVVLDEDNTYRVEYNRQANRWMIQGPGFFSGGRHATKKQAISGARTMASKGDTIKIMNKDGSHGRTVTVRG